MVKRKTKTTPLKEKELKTKLAQVWLGCMMAGVPPVPEQWFESLNQWVTYSKVLIFHVNFL